MIRPELQSLLSNTAPPQLRILDDPNGGIHKGESENGALTALELKATRHRDDFKLHVSSPCPSLHGGAVAQLGERVNGIDEVRGSNPLSSTKFSITHGCGSSPPTPNPCASASPWIRARLSRVRHATNVDTALLRPPSATGSQYAAWRVLSHSLENRDSAVSPQTAASTAIRT